MTDETPNPAPDPAPFSDAPLVEQDSGRSEEGSLELSENEGNLLLISKLVFVASLFCGLMAANSLVEARHVFQYGFFRGLSWFSIIAYFELVFLIAWLVLVWNGWKYGVLLQRFVRRGEECQKDLIEIQAYLWLSVCFLITLFVVHALLEYWAGWTYRFGG